MKEENAKFIIMMIVRDSGTLNAIRRIGELNIPIGRSLSTRQAIESNQDLNIDSSNKITRLDG